ncbi:MAG: hypothetical protein ABIG61_11640 [Planctomycetota bacterium]
MTYSRTEEKLMEFMAGLDIIDCHEHLPPEKDRTDSWQDVFTLFSHYTRHDLLSAGMDFDEWRGDEPFAGNRPLYQSLFDYNISLEKRWESFKPYWERIRYGSYARAALLTAKMVYGFDDINDQTYKPLSEAIAAENTPGIYKRMLSDRCNIKAALTQCGFREVQKPLVTVMPGHMFCDISVPWRFEDAMKHGHINRPADLDDYLCSIKAVMTEWVTKKNAVGVKFIACENAEPDRAHAVKNFKKVLQGQSLDIRLNDFEPLRNFLIHSIIDFAVEMDLVVCVHAGVWGDFRKIDSKYMLTLAPAHPQARFDLYHLGMPSVRDTIVIGKNLPNVYLNLCWTHILSQSQSCSGIDELLDQVPVNKVLAFGGDYSRPVEKVVGHLHMAREDFASVFGKRIDQGLIGFEQACRILRLWFLDNPLSLYTRLQV